MTSREKERGSKIQSQKMYDHYIGLDWSSETDSAIARMKSTSTKPTVQVIQSKIKIIKEYLKELKGSKILTFEETTGAHWLYVELKDHVDEILICNPVRNKYLSEGSKTDKIDASKLCFLLRGGLLKPVYHTDIEKDYEIRKFTSAYNDLVKATVRAKNQLSALYRSEGLNVKRNKIDKSKKMISFISEHQIKLIDDLSERKKQFENMFKHIAKGNEIIKKLDEISGFAEILSVKAYAIIIDASRFANKYRLWSYSGLVKDRRESGKHKYNRSSKNYCREMKDVIKKATKAALSGKNDIREYYEYLLKQGKAEEEARNAVSRYLATSVYVVMKNNTKYEPYYWRKKLETKAA